MTKNRIKLPPLPDDIETLVNDIALATINRQTLTARMDAELTAVRAKYTAGLAAIADQLLQWTDQAQLWALAHPQRFPDHRKSIAFAQATIGFHTSPPEVQLLKKWTWKKALEVLMEIPSLARFIRIKPEIDKEKILAERADLKPDQLALFGVKIGQDEEFFIEPNLTPVETRQTTSTP